MSGQSAIDHFVSDLLRARIFIYLQIPKVCWVFFLVSPRDFILLGLAAWPETFGIYGKFRPRKVPWAKSHVHLFAPGGEIGGWP